MTIGKVSFSAPTNWPPYHFSDNTVNSKVSLLINLRPKCLSIRRKRIFWKRKIIDDGHGLLIHVGMNLIEVMMAS
ncbi:hypothetical protein KSC_032350 [Ktedonobacter sp. SOSP1-52]|nr:hypothetical protein KSC_032350 [Ktedonobacter sp. SOSP1-52]